MRGINQQDVPRLERLEVIRGKTSDIFVNQVDLLTVRGGDRLPESLGFRLDERTLDPALKEALVGVENHARRKTGPDLDDPRGAKMPHHAVERDGVPIRIPVVVAVIAPAVLFRDWKVRRGKVGLPGIE